MIENPFAVLERRLNRLENLLLEIRDQKCRPDQLQSLMPDLLNVKRAAEFLGIARQTIYQNIDRIPHAKKHGRLYFRRDELLTYLEEGKVSQKKRA